MTTPRIRRLAARLRALPPAEPTPGWEERARHRYQESTMDTIPTPIATRCECGIWPRVYAADVAGQPIAPADLAHLANAHPEAYDRHIAIVDRDRTHEEPAAAVAAREARRRDYEARGLDSCGVPIDLTGCTYEGDTVVDGVTGRGGRGWLRDGRPV